MVTVKVQENWRDVETKANVFQRNFERYLVRMAQEAAQSIHGTERFRHTGSNKGLRNEFAVKYDNSGFDFTSVPDYSSYVDQGRGEVRPIKAKCLHFWIGGQEVFCMRARPVQAREFMKEATDHLEDCSERVFEEIFSRGAQ